jgi:hypothetical protein
MKIQDPLSKQSLMKSNAQLRRDDPDADDVPPPPPIPVGIPSVASSSQTTPPPQPDVSYSQIVEAMAAIHGGMSSMQLSMSSMQQSISTMQQKVHYINLQVKQNQLDLWECLKFHHPSSSDDEDDAPMAEDAWASFCFVVVLFSFETFVLYFATFVKLLDYITLFTLVLLRPFVGVIFVVVDFYYFVLPFVPLWQKGGVIFIFGLG